MPPKPSRKPAAPRTPGAGPRRQPAGTRSRRDGAEWVEDGAEAPRGRRGPAAAEGRGERSEGRGEGRAQPSGRNAKPGKPAPRGAAKRTPFRPPSKPRAEALPEENEQEVVEAPRPRRGAGRVAPPVRSGSRGRHAVADAKPERLHKILAQSGVGSRREMEDWIAAGRVTVNGNPAAVGQLVGPNDKVKVGGRLVHLRFGALRLPRVVLYHKPEGQIVSRDDPEGRDSVFDSLPRMRGSRWVAVGRLDYNTSGLLLFTNSGDLANRLMHPRYNLEREYAVRVLGDLDDATLRQLAAGIELEDGPARFTTLLDAGGEGANHWYRVTLSEGRNREVRRMFEAVGATVSRLIRVRYGPFQLPARLKRGATMELEDMEVAKLMREFGLPAPEVVQKRPTRPRK